MRLVLDNNAHNGNVLFKMAGRHLGTSKSRCKPVTSTDFDVEYHSLLHGRGDGGACPRLSSLKAIMAAFTRFFELPDHQRKTSGDH